MSPCLLWKPVFRNAGANCGDGGCSAADPNREGLSARLISFLRACGARRLVYVSCDVATQARDLRLLCAAAPPERQGRRPSRRFSTFTPARGQGGMR
jgi:hypothetical protein